MVGVAALVVGGASLVPVVAPISVRVNPLEIVNEILNQIIFQIHNKQMSINNLIIHGVRTILPG